MAAATTVNIETRLLNTLIPVDIPCTATPTVLWSTKTGKFKLPSQAGTVFEKAGKIVRDNSGDIQAQLRTENFFWPNELSSKLDGQGFDLPQDEIKKQRGVLEQVDRQDGNKFHGFATTLKGELYERQVLNALKASSFQCRFSLLSGLYFPFPHKFIGTEPQGGEIDAFIIFEDLNFVQIESKGELTARILEKTMVQLENGKTFLKSLVGMLSLPCPKVTLTQFLYFGEYKTRKDLNSAIQSAVPQLDNETRKRILCQEDLQDIAKLFPSVGTPHQTEYREIVSILYTASLMAKVSMTGSLEDWSKALVGKTGITDGGTVRQTPADPEKFGTIRHEPLSSDHAILFWNPEQLAAIHDLQTRAGAINGPYGSGKTQVMRKLLQLLMAHPDISKVFMISGLEWDRWGEGLESSVFILDILTGATTATDIRRELHSNEKEFWVLVPKYIQHKLDTETGNLAFLIDEAPVPRFDPDQAAWNTNWNTVTNSDRAIIRIAIRPDSYPEFSEMKKKNLLGGFTPVLLNKVVRNTSAIVEGAGGVASNHYNFPAEETTVSNITGSRPLLYLVEEEEDRIPVGALAAYQEHKSDLAPGVILCKDKEEVKKTTRVLQGEGAAVTVFTGDREEGKEAYASLKRYFQSPKGLVITTAECFSGMDSSCVLATQLDFNKGVGQTTDSQVVYRAVSKLILVATRKEAEKMERYGVLGKWDLRDAHNYPNTEIRSLAQFLTNAKLRRAEAERAEAERRARRFPARMRRMIARIGRLFD